MSIYVIEAIYGGWDGTWSKCVAAFENKEKAEQATIDLNNYAVEASNHQWEEWQTPFGDAKIDGFLYPYYQLEEVKLIKT